MRAVPMLSLVAVVCLAAACSEATSPARSVSPGSRAAADQFCSDPDDYCFDSRSLPPPPYLDTMYVARNEDGSALTGASLIRVQYFMNKTDNNGWMMFRAQTSDAVLASPDAKISIHKNSVSGKGVLSLIVPGGVLSIDLSKNLGKGTTFNGDCSKGCSFVSITNALFIPKVGKPTSFSGQLVTAPAAIIGPD